MYECMYVCVYVCIQLNFDCVEPVERSRDWASMRAPPFESDASLNILINQFVYLSIYSSVLFNGVIVQMKC